MSNRMPADTTRAKVTTVGAGRDNAALAARPDGSLRPRTGRIVTYFVVTFGLFLLILLAVGLDLAFAPSPYVLHPEAFPRSGARVEPFEDGSTARVFILPTEQAAKLIASGIAQATPHRSFSQMEGHVDLARYIKSADGRACAVLRMGKVVVAVEAADRAAVDRRLDTLDVVTKNPHQDPLFEIFDHHLGDAVIGLLIYGLGIGFFMLRGASWAARIDPRPGIPAVTGEELRGRLLQVNELGLPWRLEERRPGVFRAEWVYADARWVAAAGAGGISAKHRLTLRLDESRRRVSVTESERSFTYGGGFLSFFASFSYWRGITFFAYEASVGAGLIFRDGRWQVAEAYRYRFSSSEMQNPLVEATVDSGWTYAPSPTQIRWLGG
jgi:hypothetical protein